MSSFSKTYQLSTIPIATSLCSPSIRMVRVEVALLDDGFNLIRCVDSIIAIRSEVHRCYRKKLYQALIYDEPSCIDKAELEGWEAIGQEESTKAMFYHVEFGIIPVDHELVNTNDSLFRVVVLPWTYDEKKDSKAICEVADDMVVELRKRKELEIKRRGEQNTAKPIADYIAEMRKAIR